MHPRAIFPMRIVCTVFLANSKFMSKVLDKRTRAFCAGQKSNNSFTWWESVTVAS